MRITPAAVPCATSGGPDATQAVETTKGCNAIANTAANISDCHLCICGGVAEHADKQLAERCPLMCACRIADACGIARLRMLGRVHRQELCRSIVPFSSFAQFQIDQEKIRFAVGVRSCLPEYVSCHDVHCSASLTATNIYLCACTISSARASSADPIFNYPQMTRHLFCGIQFDDECNRWGGKIWCHECNGFILALRGFAALVQDYLTCATAGTCVRAWLHVSSSRGAPWSSEKKRYRPRRRADAHVAPPCAIATPSTVCMSNT